MKEEEKWNVQYGICISLEIVLYRYMYIYYTFFILYIYVYIVSPPSDMHVLPPDLSIALFQNYSNFFGRAGLGAPPRLCVILKGRYVNSID